MARNEQLIRQHKILQILEASRFGKTLEELREVLVDDLGLTSLHERTVRRDVEALQAAGFDLQTEMVEARGRVWKMGRADKGLHKISATSTELIALSIGRDLLYPLAGTQYWKGIESFWHKVRDVLPEGVWEHYNRYRKALHVFGIPAKTYEEKEGILKTINRAIQEHRVVEIDYKPVHSAASTRRIEPYGLAVNQSSIYVIAVLRGAKDPDERLRHWKLDRFLKATALDEWFKPDPGIDVEQHLGRSMGIFSGPNAAEVEIRLSELAAGWLREEPWHANQQLTPQDDGHWLLRVPAAHPRELIPRLLGLGPEAEVLAPDDYRDAVAETVRNLAAIYRDPAAVTS